jgi:hypothetical protein
LFGHFSPLSFSRVKFSSREYDLSVSVAFAAKIQKESGFIKGYFGEFPSVPEIPAFSGSRSATIDFRDASAKKVG